LPERPAAEKDEETHTKFGDLRGWIAHLAQEGELHEIGTEVDWDCELGTVTRRAFGNGDGPALMFNRIKDYSAGRCTRLFTGGLSNYSRVALMFGLPKKAPITELVKAARKAYAGRLPPVTVATGPVKENILKGSDIDLFEFPVPRWHRRDGGRYINTMQGTVTRDPATGRINVGIYRGMIGKKDTIPVLLWRPQNWGQDFAKYSGKGEEMPVDLLYGWEPAAVLRGVAGAARRVQYDVMGALRGRRSARRREIAAAGPRFGRDRDRGRISARSRDLRNGRAVGEYTGYFGASGFHTGCAPPASPTATIRSSAVTLGHLAQDAQREFHHELGIAGRAWNILERSAFRGH
jgi:hypothetical protein